MNPLSSATSYNLTIAGCLVAVVGAFAFAAYVTVRLFQ